MNLHNVPGGGIPLIGSNHREGARIATRHLIGLGHTSIGTITGPFRRHVVRSRLHGYEDALRTAGIEPAEDLTVECDWTPASASVATRLLLQRDPGVTAIFVHSDTMAIGVLSALAAAWCGVPAAIAVVSCDDMPFAEYLIPALSSLRVPFEETGEQSVELLLKKHRRAAHANRDRAAAGRAHRARLLRRPCIGERPPAVDSRARSRTESGREQAR